MTKRFLLLLILCLFISALSPAQISIQGKVQDEFSQNLPSTTVRLLTTDSLLIKGTYTNQYGEFVFSEISSGNYLLCCSFLGYQLRYVSISVNQKDTVIPPIQLLPTSHELSEVFVEAPSYIRKSDRVLVIPKQNQIAHASTGYDLLYNLMIPGISVDQRKGSVSSFGRSVTLYLNGRKADSREIKNIRPKDILNVQYHDVPTGKYSGDFASINIVTKDYDQGGYVAIDGKQTIGFKRGDYNLAAKKSAGNWDFTFFAGYQMEDHSGISEAREETFHFQERNITRRSQTLDSHFKQDQQYYQFFISHNRDKRTLLGRISLFANATPINHQIRENIYANTSIKKQIEDLNSNQKSLMPELYLYGSFNITEKQTLDLSFRGNYARNNYERDYTEGEYSTRIKVMEDFYNMDFNANYALGLNNGQSLAFRIFHFDKLSKSTYGEKKQQLWTGETILFSEYKKQFSNYTTLRIQPGVSSLIYKLNSEKNISQVSPRLQMGISFLPARGQFLQFGVNIGNSYPEIKTMNRVSQVVDFLQIQRGNPDMKKTSAYAANVAYSFAKKRFKVQLFASYMFADNMTTNSYYVENDRLINSFNDGNHYHSFESHLGATWSITQNLNLKLDSYLIKQLLNGNTAFNSTTFVSALGLCYIWNDFAINLYGTIPYESAGDFYALSHIKTPVEYGFNASWTKGNLMIEVGVDNPFLYQRKVVKSFVTNVYQFNSSLINRENQQCGFIKVSYNFDFGHKAVEKDKRVDSKIGSAIMKAN